MKKILNRSPDRNILSILSNLNKIIEVNDVETFDNYKKIKYNNGGIIYNLYIPHSNRRNWVFTKVFAIRDGKEIDITHEPGIHYCVSVKDFGAEKFIVKNLSGEVIAEFRDRIPGDWFPSK